MFDNNLFISKEDINTTNLTTTMISLDRTIQAFIEADVRKQVIVLVGGVPVNQDFTDKIGADGYASNAASAAELARKLINQKRS